MQSDKGILQKTIDWLSENRKIYISIHDTSGIITNIPQLVLPVERKMHYCDFCNAAKTTSKGLKLCLKCKQLSLVKLQKKQFPYMGTCYLGITEVVMPVTYQGGLMCVIYVGNMICTEDIEKIKLKYKHLENLTGVPGKMLAGKTSTLEQVERNKLFQYFEAAEIVKRVILSELNFDNVPDKHTAKTTNYIINSVINHTKAYYSNEISLNLLAKIHFINPDYLCRLFKKETGFKFSNYLNIIRIEKAKDLLNNTDNKITDIALKVGYASDTYFIRQFKKFTDITPKQYRKRQKLQGKKR